MKKKLLAAALCLALLLCACSGSGSGSAAVKLDPKNPVTITVWHYYGGVQKDAFDLMLDRFNETVGAEKGIYVESHNQGGVNQLEESVLAAVNKQIGSDEVPNIFASYADTAYAIEKMGYLIDLEQYLTPEETAEYVDSYIEEGRIGAKGELKIFPTAKSTETFLLNRTDWEVFSQATGASLEELATMEGLVEVAQRYYEWTDSLTPDVAGDGRSFYGRDAMANYFIIGSMQLGHEIFHVENQAVTLDVDKETMRRLWDNYYVPFVKGYFGAYGKFRSDDLRIGKIIAFTGSTTSMNYFPAVVESGDLNYPIEPLLISAPMFEGGKPYAVQQGAGMVVTKSTPEKEYASVEFLKWFTETGRNLEFSAASGYLPVKKEAATVEQLDKAIADNGFAITPLAYEMITKVFEDVSGLTLYTNKAFDGGANARKVLEYNLSDKAAADRAEVLAAMAAGQTMEEAAAPYLTDENFEEWFAQFTAALEEAAQ